ncbi:hypothetical protein ACNFU2_17970 [Chryseobacterium sp. PTM-20240506]|uniref:hypothetical protein n=1 Tax=Chryseobacterium sp. PTM-20240506 TaxID=3400631 RepID=UPI003AAFC7E2
MNTVRISINESSFEKYKENITGVVHLDFGDFSFPEKNWNDFVIVIMNNWIKSISNIKLGISEYADLLFFDGSFYIRIKMTGKDNCLIECIENHRTEKIIFKEQIKFKNLEKEIFTTAKLCKVFCTRQNWRSEELDELDYLLRK